MNYKNSRPAAVGDVVFHNASPDDIFVGSVLQVNADGSAILSVLRSGGATAVVQLSNCIHVSDVNAGPYTP